MDLRDYQRRATDTSQLRHGGPHAAVTPLLGLAAQAGSTLNVYKHYLRDGVGMAASHAALGKELGDLLWYVAAVATACRLDLAEVAKANLQRARDMYPTADDLKHMVDAPVLDTACPPQERFPRRLVVEVAEHQRTDGRPVVELVLVAAEPNPFREGPRVEQGRELGFQVGDSVGDPLTDNSRRTDGYRFHDAIHFGFLAVLGWSPNLRALLRLKRRSDPVADECEDGARAIFAEEGLAAVLSRLAARRAGFLAESAVTGEIIDVARAATTDLEVTRLPGWLWRRAICHGFQALRQLTVNRGGYLIANLDARQLRYVKCLTDEHVPDHPALGNGLRAIGHVAGADHRREGERHAG